MEWRAQRIQTKFLLGTIGIVMVLGLAMVLFVKIVFYKKLYANLEKRGVFIASKIAADSVGPVLTERLFDLQMMVKDLKNAEEDIEYIFVVNAKDDVVVHSFEDGFPEDLQNLNNRDNGRQNGIRRLESEKGIILDFSAPLLNGTIGRIHVGLSETPIRQSVNNTVMLLLGAIVLILAIGGGLAIALAASITKPIHLLAVAVQAMERGDLGARTPVQSKDEIGQLASAFNRMAGVRMYAEAALRTSEKKLQDITSHLAEGLYVFDVGGQITFMNPGAERLLGWSRDELNEKGAHALVHYRTADGRPLPFETCAMHNVVRTGKGFASSDEVFVRKDGTVFPISVVCSPIIEDGRIVASVTAFRDITKQKELEKEREQLILDYQKALDKVKTLKGLISICASCKKIRDDSGYWGQIEVYIRDHSDAEFSHGICPECAKKLYPDFCKDET